MLFEETMLTLADAARVLPRVNKKRVHPSTLWRWSSKGINGVRLETWKMGRRVVTSLEALERFSKALANVPPNGHTASPRTTQPKKTRSEIQHELAVRRAEEELRKEGI